MPRNDSFKMIQIAFLFHFENLSNDPLTLVNPTIFQTFYFQPQTNSFAHYVSYLWRKSQKTITGKREDYACTFHVAITKDTNHPWRKVVGNKAHSYIHLVRSFHVSYFPPIHWSNGPIFISREGSRAYGGAQSFELGPRDRGG